MSPIRPSDVHRLEQRLDRFELLSLDCFDTLLWRRGAAPQDVFTALDLPGGALARRMGAEARARTKAGGGEVDLAAIYRELMPRASEDERAAAIARELTAEAEHCYAFTPVVKLLLAAKAKGLRTMVVSDTYLDETQLRALIAAVAGDDVARAIDDIHCSSTHGVGKAAGLFERLLPRVGCRPEAIIHLGDNQVADFKAPRRLGIEAVHLLQFDPVVARRLRLEAAAAAAFDPAVRVSRPAWQPHRPAVAMSKADDPAGRLGATVLAPLLETFAQWVADEALASDAKPVFLLRDGFLPARASEAMGYGKATTASISRFAARRASFRGIADIDDYFATERHHRLDVHARTLGLHDREWRDVGDMIGLRRLVRAPATTVRIVERSTAFAKRLAQHLRRAGIKAGDRIQFVDLGYNGSVQNLVGPMLQREHGLFCSGRYLLLRENDVSGLDKRGLFDCRHHDDQLLSALTRSIAVVEQLCTNGLGSVVDYRDKGEAIFLASKMSSARQHGPREAVQLAALNALAERQHPVATSEEMRRTGTLGILSRLLFMPLAEEAELLSAFDHDVNLGTRDANRLLDRDQGREDRRRDGFKALGRSARLFTPAELTAQSFDLTLAHLAAARHAFDLRNADVRQGGISVPVIFADAHGQELAHLEAWPTCDGFYRLEVPVGSTLAAAGVLVGSVAGHVELASVTQIEAARLADDHWNGREGRAAPRLTLDGLTLLAGQLYSCDEHAIALAEPVRDADAGDLVLEFVFRPIGAPSQAALRLAA